MDKILKFGTAGIRAKMGPQEHEINITNCYRIAWAVAHYLTIKKFIKPVLVGFDNRSNSLDFAKEVAQVVSLFGLPVHLFSHCCPTPVLAFLAKEMKASIAFMITASHNPKEDNGIKLFDHYGGQVEKAISQYIEDLILMSPSRIRFYEDNKNKSINILPLEFNNAKNYFDNICDNKYFLDKEIDKTISTIYTPIHGVGKKYFLHAFYKLGFKNINLVEEQANPDKNFPTVVLPNPEEEGALDLAYKLAKEKKSDLVIANDPDADRFLAMVYYNGDYYKMSGNEIGVVLAYFAILDAQKKGLPNIAVATTLVSSRMLKAMADKMNINYFESLTGFSNIKEEALKLKKEKELNLVFAFEEALGFSSSACLYDKDGIGSALRFIEIAAFLKKNKSHIISLLEKLYIEFGIYRQRQWYQIFLGDKALESMNLFMNSLRQKDMKIENLNKIDLLIPHQGPYGQWQTNMMIFEDTHGFRLLVRPSGTESKIKFYMEKRKVVKDKNKIKEEKENLDIKLIELENNIKNIMDGI